MNEKQAILLTVSTPGWAAIVKRAQRRIDAAKLAALENRDEAKFLDLYRRAHAAYDALREFVEEIETEAEDNEHTGN